MNPNLFTLTVNAGAAVTLRSLGIVNPVVTKVALDVSTLAFTVPVDDISAAAPFAYNDILRLYRAGAIHFVGRVKVIKPSFNGTESLWSITACDAWWEMERTIYQQPVVHSNAAFTGLVSSMSTRVTLGQNAWGESIPQDEQIANAIAFGAGKNPDIIALASATAADAWPREETHEITVAEATRRAASLAAISVGSMAYVADGPAQLTLQARSALTLATIDLDDADRVIESDGPRRRDDLVPPGVVFEFWQDVDDGSGNIRAKLTKQSAGSPGAAGTLRASFKIGPCDTIPVDAALAYYNALTTHQWEGTLHIMDEDCPGTIKPGCRLRFTNGQVAWATMDAVVQRVTEDLYAGVTTVEYGPSVVLGQDEFIDQLIRLRARPVPTGYCDIQHNGNDGVEGGLDDDGNPIPVPPGGAPGSEPGIDGPPGSNPGGGSGGNGGAGAGSPGGGLPGGTFGSTTLTLCDGNSIEVLTK